MRKMIIVTGAVLASASFLTLLCWAAANRDSWGYIPYYTKEPDGSPRKFLYELNLLGQ